MGIVSERRKGESDSILKREERHRNHGNHQDLIKIQLSLEPLSPFFRVLVDFGKERNRSQKEKGKKNIMQCTVSALTTVKNEYKVVKRY